MKDCKKCKQSFFDEVEECACGSKKFVYTVPPIIEPIITKKKDEDDDDMIAEQDYEKKAEEVLRQKWGEPIRTGSKLIPATNVFSPLQAGFQSKPISTPAITRITPPFGLVGKTTNRTPITLRNTSYHKIDPLTNKPMAFPLSKREADEYYRSMQQIHTANPNLTRQQSFNQYKRDQLLKRHKEDKDDE